MTKENQRNSYTITIRAGADDVNLSELIAYLKAIGRTQANQKIESLIMMGMLALAKKHSGKYTPEQLAMFCLENANNLSNYSSFLRQAFGLVDPQLHSNLLQTGVLSAPQQQVGQLTRPQPQPLAGEINGVNVNGAVNLSSQSIAAHTANLPLDSQIGSPIVDSSISNQDSDPEDDDFPDEPDFDRAFGD